MALEKVVYTAHAKATGGRDGIGKTDDGKLEVKLQLPKEMGGTGEGTNPEQLFAVGYAACFIGAFGPLAHGAKGFGIAAALEVHIPGVDHEKATELVNLAHEICPYSNATRGNIDVTLTVA